MLLKSRAAVMSTSRNTRVGDVLQSSRHGDLSEMREASQRFEATTFGSENIFSGRANSAGISYGYRILLDKIEAPGAIALFLQQHSILAATFDGIAHICAAVFALAMRLGGCDAICKPSRATTMRQVVFYRTVKVDGLSIFYREAGPKEAQTLLLLHGLPSSSRMFEPLPMRVQSLIVQNAVAHDSGLGIIWKTRRAYWADRAAHESELRLNLLSLATTKTRHVGTDPAVDRYDPDLWTDEFAFLSQPNQADIQSDLFYDYRTNVAAYPSWQAWMRKNHPPMLVIWGQYDPSFDISEPEAYRRDVPGAEVHILKAGHFALDTNAHEIAALVAPFVRKIAQDRPPQIPA
jgi:pimeloyl-ACP methyl ester carboxylesterase